jgi:hypothetical protein
MYERENNYIAIDPKTQKPLEKDSKFMFKIVAIITEVIGANEDETRITFQVQKYWKDKTYKIQKSPTDSAEITKNSPFCERRLNGDLKDTGERMIDADDFVSQFKAIVE